MSIGNDNMNTPETDKAERMAFSQEYMVPTEFARRLERARDEWAKLCGQYKQERDEARTELAQLKEGEK